jgi:hypothetical protein
MTRRSQFSGGRTRRERRGRGREMTMPCAPRSGCFSRGPGRRMTQRHRARRSRVGEVVRACHISGTGEVALLRQRRTEQRAEIGGVIPDADRYSPRRALTGEKARNASPHRPAAGADQISRVGDLEGYATSCEGGAFRRGPSAGRSAGGRIGTYPVVASQRRSAEGGRRSATWRGTRRDARGAFRRGSGTDTADGGRPKRRQGH